MALYCSNRELISLHYIKLGSYAFRISGVTELEIALGDVTEPGAVPACGLYIVPLAVASCLSVLSFR